MQIETEMVNGKTIAVVSEVENRIDGTASALEMMMNIKTDCGAERIALPKTAFVKEFFVLSTGLAGEILQKFINYQVKLAIYGDFTGYTSKPLHDFIYESNNGKYLFFTETRETAVCRLAEV